MICSFITGLSRRTCHSSFLISATRMFWWFSLQMPHFAVKWRRTDSELFVFDLRLLSTVFCTPELTPDNSVRVALLDTLLWTFISRFVWPLGSRSKRPSLCEHEDYATVHPHHFASCLLHRFQEACEHSRIRSFEWLNLQNSAWIYKIRKLA